MSLRWTIHLLPGGGGSPDGSDYQLKRDSRQKRGIKTNQGCEYINSISNLMLKQLLKMTMSPHLKCAAGVTQSQAALRTPGFPLTPCVSSRVLWWMNLIFLSTSDYFYVYLDIFLMGFHLSSTEWTGQEGRAGERERGSQSKWDKEAGGQWGNGNKRVARSLQKVFKEICSERYCSAETSEVSGRTLEFTPWLDLHGISVTFIVSSGRSGEVSTLH